MATLPFTLGFQVLQSANPLSYKYVKHN